jgi:O-antigen ligase
MGADVVEEVVFSHVNGQVPHRYAASQRLSFMRAHNFDLYIILVAIILATVSVMGFALTKAVKSLSVAYKSQKKSKTL